MAYNGSVELISGITPANGQDFPLVAAHAVQVDDDGTRRSRIRSGMAGMEQ